MATGERPEYFLACGHRSESPLTCFQCAVEEFMVQTVAEEPNLAAPPPAPHELSITVTDSGQIHRFGIRGRKR